MLRTYKIDDLSFDKSVNDQFELRDGTKITYLEYYAKKYPGVSITDNSQPLLASMPTTRESRGGASGPVFLIPELCFMTGVKTFLNLKITNHGLIAAGMTDEQRSNFQLMKQMADYTRQGPG